MVGLDGHAPHQSPTADCHIIGTVATPGNVSAERGHVVCRFTLSVGSLSFTVFAHDELAATAADARSGSLVEVHGLMRPYPWQVEAQKVSILCQPRHLKI